MRIIPVHGPHLPTGRLDETANSRRDQRNLILRLLAQWACSGLHLDAIDLGRISEVDYLVVGQEPGPPFAAVECKRRHGLLRYPSVFLELRKRDALLDLTRGGGTPLFATRWDDQILIANLRKYDLGSIPVEPLSRRDRHRANDTDLGQYLPISLTSILPV